MHYPSMLQPALKQTILRFICIVFFFSGASTSAPLKLNPGTTSPGINKIQQPAFSPFLKEASAPITITYFSPKTCVNKGDKVRFTGTHFGDRKGKSLAINGANLHIDITADKWTESSIVATIPHDNRLKQSGRYQIGIESSDHKKWLASRQYVRLCAAEKQTVPPHAQQITSAYSPVAGTINNQQNNSQSPVENNNVVYYPSDDNKDSGFSEPETSKLDYTNRMGTLLNSGQLPPPESLQLRTTDKKKQQHEPGELIIVSINMDDAITMQQELSTYGLRVLRRKKLNNIGLVISTLGISGDVQASQILPELYQQYPNLWVTLNTRYRIQSAKNRSATMKMVGWKKSTSACGSKLRIGLIDTMIDTSHVAFKGQSIQQKSIISRGIKPASTDHGTAIAGLLIGSPESPENTGLLPAASLIAANVFRKGEDSANTTAEILIRALDWLIEQNVDAINMSLGGPENAILTLAIESTLAKGIPIISSAGNGGATSTPPYPAAQAGVIGVTAIDSRHRLFADATAGEHVDFAAPGVDIWVSLSAKKNGYRSGTSYATPFVTAALLMAKQQSPNKNPLEVLQKNVVDLGDKGKDKQFGWGLVALPNTCTK